MNTEEAKKIAEAIVLCVAAAYGKGQTVGELKQKCLEILTTEPAAPAEKEYRAGEWVPKFGMKYWHYDAGAAVDWELWYGETIDNVWLSGGNVFPTEAIAEAAKKHAEFWRAFDIADEGGIWELSVNTQRNFLRPYQVSGYEQSGSPKFKSEERARAWVDSHGGEAYVSEMLTKGRVFRFKWGGQ